MSSNGSVFATGRSFGAGSSNDYATVAHDAVTGDQLWATRYNGPSNGIEFSLALDVSPDGSSVYVTGGSQGVGTSFDYATVAYDADSGEELWVARYNGPTGGSDTAQSVDVSPDGSRVIVTGSGPGTSTGNDYATVAYEADSGEELWVPRYSGPGDGADFAQAVSVSPNASRVVVTGQSSGAGTAFDYATVTYNAASGAELWAARYNGPANASDFATALGISEEGSRVVVTGESLGVGTGSDYATVAYNADSGEQAWVARHNGAGNSGDAAEALVISPDGSRCRDWPKYGGRFGGGLRYPRL